MQRFLATPWIVAAAVSSRWLFCFIVFPGWLTDVGTVGDHYFFDSYRDLATQLLAGNGYRTSPDGIPCLHRPPVYVGVLLSSFPGSESTRVFVQLLHGLLGGVAAWLTVALARGWGATNRASSFAGWGVALWPFLIWETKITVPENLLVVLVPAIFVAFGRWQRSLQDGSSVTGWLVLSGVLVGTAVLTHAVYQLLIPVLGLVLLLVGDRRRFTSAAVFALCATLVVSPWLLRNASVAGGPMGVATGFGLHYLRGEHNWRQLLAGEPYLVDHDAGSAAVVDSLLREHGFDTSDDDFKRSDPATNRFLDAEAWRSIRHRPDQLLLRSIVRLPVPWIHQQTAIRSLANALLLLPFFVLAGIGLRRRWQPILLGPLLALLALNLGVAAIYPEAIPMRYALPWVPLLMAFAALGVDSRRTRSAAGDPSTVTGR